MGHSRSHSDGRRLSRLHGTTQVGFQRFDRREFLQLTVASIAVVGSAAIAGSAWSENLPLVRKCRKTNLEAGQ